LHQESPNDIAVIEWHKDDEFEFPVSPARISYYYINGYPTSVFDGGDKFAGGIAPNNYSVYKPVFDERLTTPSNFVIDMEITNLKGTDYNVTATIEMLEGNTSDDLVALVALTETDCPSPGYANQNFVARAAYPDQYGTPVDFSTQTTQTVNQTITLDDEGISGIKEAENTLEVASYPVQNKKDNYKVHSKGIPVSSLQENNDKMETAKSARIMMTMEKEYQPARFENSSYTDFDDYLKKNLHYGNALTETGIQDTVLIECSITREGFIKNCKIIKKTNRLLDQEALRVLKNSPRWIPAKEKGIAVKQKRIFSIVFRVPKAASEK